MDIGVVLPQGELAYDASELREYLQGIDELGFAHILSFDHVVGADPTVYPEQDFPYTIDHPFHEPLVLFGFIAGCTPRLAVATAVLVLPQRQTVLAAKQAAEIDILTAGKLRLGVSTGWNSVEYEALGAPFRARGARLEEQIGILRRLWTEEQVDMTTDLHRLHGVALNPLPIQRPIPIWSGGFAEAARKRAARFADGYFPPWPLPSRPLASNWPARLEEMSRWRKQFGHTRPLGLEPRVSAAQEALDRIHDTAYGWVELGATHLAVQTTGLGLNRLSAHLERLSDIRAALADFFVPTIR